MSNRFLDSYGILSNNTKNMTIISGRYSFQKNQVKKIPKDIINTLNIKKDDSCLDIGCNLGLNLLPISKIAKSITGIDAKSNIEKLKKKNLI